MKDGFVGKSQIVGTRIVSIHECRHMKHDDVNANAIILTLDNGVACQLPYIADEFPTGFPAAKMLSEEKCVVIDTPSMVSTATIIDIVATEFWPSVGLMLDNNLLVYASDDPVQRSVGVAWSFVGELYEASDVRSVPW